MLSNFTEERMGEDERKFFFNQLAANLRIVCYLFGFIKAHYDLALLTPFLFILQFIKPLHGI